MLYLSSLKVLEGCPIAPISYALIKSIITCYDSTIRQKIDSIFVSF